MRRKTTKKMGKAKTERIENYIRPSFKRAPWRKPVSFSTKICKDPIDLCPLSAVGQHSSHKELLFQLAQKKYVTPASIMPEMMCCQNRDHS